jgi:hypothetical protein
MEHEGGNMWPLTSSSAADALLPGTPLCSIVLTRVKTQRVNETF